VILAADNDEWACQSHAFNSNALVCCRDLSDPDQTVGWLRSLHMPPVALVSAGFPCQPYSRAGHSIIRHLVAADRRPEVDKRTFAWQSFIAAVEELRPERALAENVPDLARFNDGRQLRDIARALEELDYEVDIRILPARLYGVPQFRERLFIQAVRQESAIAWPIPSSEVDDTLRAAIGDLPELDAGQREDVVPYEPRSDPPGWAREGVSETDAHLLWDHTVRDVRRDDLEAFERLRPGGTYLDVPEELRRYDDANFTDKYKRLEWDRPSRTITAHIARDGYWYIHPEQHRSLSIREAARIQTFPDWFRFAGFPSNRLAQIGNAVPPLLARAIGQAMLGGGEEAASSAISRLPAAARALKQAAKANSSHRDEWRILVSEVVFNGRAGKKRIKSFLEAFPEPRSAAAVRAAQTDHEGRAGALARSLLAAGNTVPTDPKLVQAMTGAAPAVARLVVSMVHGETLPRSEATIRVAERVSGVRRAGSLNGVADVALARLADFGAEPAANELLVDLARSLCFSDRPLCGHCPLNEFCVYAAGPSDGDAREAEAALF
jgi:DNA (cytosine-5)-methyltransferase 1